MRRHKPPAKLPVKFAQDQQGDLWIANQDHGLLPLSKDGTVQQISWANIGHKDGAKSLAADRSTGGLWFGFGQGGVAYFSDGQIKETYGGAEGLGSGRVSALYIETDDTVWAATECGLSRIKNGRVISVTDNGVGLPAERADQIFNAFFTTKPHGTGMGLAITRSIVESHGGRVWAAANPERGTTFHFTLPIRTAVSA